jgi:nitrogen fixation protein FixH
MTTASNSRNPWPIAIVTFFIVFAMFIATFIAWATHQREDLVAANYYENEVRYQQQLDRMNQTQPLAAQVAVRYDAAQHSIVITLPVAQTREAAGRIYLYRPSDARLDRDVQLAVNPEGVQHLNARGLRAGLWKVRVQWSANGKDYFVERSVLVAAGAPISESARTDRVALNAPNWSSAFQ